MANMTNIFEMAEYINNNLNDKSIINKCCEKIDLSKERFDKMFKLYIGFLPEDYFNKMKLKKCAKQLFTEEDMNKIALDNGYDSYEDFKEQFIHEFGVEPSEYYDMSRKVITPLEELSEIELIVAFFPAPNHVDSEHRGDLLYKEHEKIYNILIEKGYFEKDTLGYSIARQITEKYAYDCQFIIKQTIKSDVTLDELYNLLLKVHYIPKVLFYHFVGEMMENGLLDNTKLRCRKECFKCTTFKATIYDANYLRENVIEEYKMKNINIDKKSVNCLGCFSGEYADYCEFLSKQD